MKPSIKYPIIAPKQRVPLLEQTNVFKMQTRQQLKQSLVNPSNTNRKCKNTSNFKNSKKKRSEAALKLTINKDNGSFKELIVKITPLEYMSSTLTTETEKPQSLKRFESKRLSIDLVPLQLNSHTPEITEKDETNNRKLRKLRPKCYIEDSPLATPINNKTNNSNLPIYKRIRESTVPKNKDVYEFTDISPKMKKKRKKSSVGFEKTSSEILKRLEQKEARAKKRIAKPKKKTNDRVIANVLTNVKEKILNRKQANSALPTKDNSKNVVLINNLEKQVEITATNKNNDNNQLSSLVESNFCAAQTKSPKVVKTVESPRENFFGFEEIPSNNVVNILNNILITKGQEQKIESPIVNFDSKRPNANSTLICTQKSSPWRSSWLSFRRNPHFISLKNNGLPRLDQDMVMDHSLVESFEQSCSKTAKDLNETPKKTVVQQSILDFVESNVEKENPVYGSLYDYDAFNSPPKKSRQNKEAKVDEVKRNILMKESNIFASTPARKALADISNSSNETSATYFGFGDISLEKSPNKSKGGDKENNGQKPFRFNLSKLTKSYGRRNKIGKEPSCQEDKANEESEAEISINDPNGRESNEPEVHLFDEPEEMLGNPLLNIDLIPNKKKRKILNSADISWSDDEKEKKRPKNRKINIEEENWIKEFNEMCKEVNNFELELE